MNTAIKVLKSDSTIEVFDADKIIDELKYLKSAEGTKCKLKEFLIKSFLIKYPEGCVLNEEDFEEELINTLSAGVNADSMENDGAAAHFLINRINKSALKRGETFYKRVLKNVAEGKYDKALIEEYSEEEFNDLEKNVIKYERDEMLSYAGVRQFSDKYLIRENKCFCENIQECNALISMTIFSKSANRLSYIKKFYDLLSLLKISIPTPVYSGVRTPIRSYSSCCVIDCGDSVDSILATNYVIGKAVTKRYGIGVNINRIRGIGANISKSSAVHTGVVPILKMIEASTKGFSQGVRAGSATVSVAFWHWEILTVLDLKNNRGVTENRVRNIDYAIGLNKLFLQRVKDNADITLFSSEEVPLLTNRSNYLNEEFKRIYEEYEASDSIKRKVKVSAVELLKKIIRERYETGRIYVYFIDNMNEYSCFKESVFCSNLCQEITLPTAPITLLGNNSNFIENEGLIGVCILSCINVGRLSDTESFTELKDICEVLVRFLNLLIDHQNYDFPQLEKCALNYRPLGIGVSDLFHLLALKHLDYSTRAARNYVHRLMEAFQYYLLRASCLLAKEQGRCNAFAQSKYSESTYLPTLCYKKAVDNIVDEPLHLDWALLRIEINKYGLRNTCLSAIPPTASSSSISNSTPGIDPPKQLITTKMSKHGVFKQAVPEIASLADYYKTQSSIINKKYLKLIAVIQKFVDQGVSTNTYYLVEKKDVSLQDVASEIFNAYSYGLKSLYYLNANKGVDSDIARVMSAEGFLEEDLNEGCSGGACSI